jgi:voltage-gated potassium channel
MTVITVASVGYGEINPLSENGRIFTIFLILSGSGVLIYSVSSITALVVEGDLSDVLKRMAMTKTIERLSGHYIVCGDSQTGRYVIEELLKTGKPFVVIDKDHAKIDTLRGRDILCLEGDATTDAALQAAGIERAEGLLTSLHSDAENLFVVLTAKGLNPSLKVISKALDEASRQKLIKVGADGVVMPNHIGAMRMVSEMIRPGVVTFLDLMLRAKDKTIRVEEIVLPPASSFVGKTLQDSGMLDEPDVTVVAFLEPDGAYRFNPSRQAVLEQGRTIIVMGNVAGIDHIRRKAGM